MKQNDLAYKHFKIALRIDPQRQQIVNAMAEVLPNRPAHLKVLWVIMRVIGAPYYLVAPLFRNLPALDVPVFKPLIFCLIGLYPSFIFQVLLRWSPGFAEKAESFALKMFGSSSDNGMGLLNVFVVLLPWMLFFAASIVYTEMSAKIIRNQLSKE